MALHQGYLETGHAALLVEIRSRRVNEIIQRAALPPPPLAIPSPVRVGGFFKSRCATCPKICWTKATHSPTTCGSCKKNGTIYCSICCDHGPLMPMGLCHDFCATCLGKYISIKIDDGEVEKGTVACPFPGCDHPISVTVIEHLIKKNLLSAAHALRLKELKHADHRSYLQYVLSGEDPALTAWAMKNTQSCPECYTIVQKTSGCNHITCKCKKEFCYGCGHNYKKLPSNHSCKSNALPTLNPQGLEVACIECSPDDSSTIVTVKPPPASRSVASAAPPPLTTDEARSCIAAILTLQCPNCERAVSMDADFDQCFSLRCSSCPASFCAWCLRVAADGEDPHSHVLDCVEAPAGMRGSALYLQEGTCGVPHVPPHPHRKFVAHWRNRHRRLAMRVIESAEEGAFDKKELIAELEAMLDS